jgi:LPXTG-motif cell wall-anchored protein
MKKALLSLALAAALVAMFAAPAFAARADLVLGLDIDDTSEGDRLSWRSISDPEDWSGEGNLDRSFTTAEMAQMDSWVIEFNNDVSDLNLAFVYAGNGCGWWNGANEVMSVSGAVVTIDLAALRANDSNFVKIGDDPLGKLIIAIWDSGFPDAGGVKASWVTGANIPGGGNGGEGTPPPPPGSSGGDGDKESAKTGDTAMIALAIAALTLAAGATVFVVRKIKA